MEQEYYVMYGIDAGDDYLKFLTAEEFESVKEAIKKFTSSECVFCDLPDQQRLKLFKNNVTYLAKKLIEKRELELISNSVVFLDGDDVDDMGSDDEAKEIINTLIENAEFIKKLTVEFLYRFRVLSTEIFVFKLIFAE